LTLDDFQVRVNYARDRARRLSEEVGCRYYAVRVGTIFGPTRRGHGWRECFGIFEGGKEIGGMINDDHAAGA